MATEPEFSEIERRLGELELDLLQPGIRTSPASVSLLLAEDFYEFGASGRVLDRTGVISALQKESVSRFEISALRVTVLNSQSALVTYKALLKNPLNHSQAASLRSSVWVFRDNRWQVLFHQGTRVSCDPDCSSE